MSDTEALRRLYRDTVLQHSREPRNLHRMEQADRCADGHNPLCGDRITLYLRMPDETITDAAFEATGCAISLASASMLTEAVKHHTRTDALTLSRDVQSMLEGRTSGQSFGDLDALSGVSAYPTRVRCAALPWRTLQAALDGRHDTVSTESGSP